MTDRIPVRVRACACPDTPHPDGDVVYILPTISLEGGMAAEAELAAVIAAVPLPAGAGEAERARVAAERTRRLRPRWFRAFIEHGAVGWNLVGEGGAPVPFDAAAVVADYSLGRVVAEACDARYSDAVLAPFQAPPGEHSPTGPTAGGTSRPPKRTRSQSG